MMAMAMITEGFKVFAGSALKNILQYWTLSIYRALLTGALITAFVQSSSAVTVATIGFVNAGMISLRQAIGVIFGTNVGTTMTGWLVSIVGFDIKIEALAMPILALGVIIRYTSALKRKQGFGQSLIGLALFFLGLSILKSTFSDITDNFGTGIFTTSDVSGAWIFVLVGFFVTALTQSSSAAIALILTAASEGIIGINVAAAAVIGANIGTTSTAVIAAFNATPNAKRVAAGHVAFNVITGLVALSLLPLFIWSVSGVDHLIGIKDQPALFLALFHTSFNLLGVILIAPFTRQMTSYLEKMFRTEEEEISHPRYLDKRATDTPVMAMAALWKELNRLYDLSCNMVLLALKAKKAKTKKIQNQSEAIYNLGKTINEFSTNLRMVSMAREQSEELAISIRAARYLEEVMHLAHNLWELVLTKGDMKNKRSLKLLEEFLIVTQNTVTAFSHLGDEQIEKDNTLEELMNFQEAYQKTKAGFLSLAAEKHLSIDQVEELLDHLSRSRRLMEQLAKADRAIHANRDGMIESPPLSDE